MNYSSDEEDEQDLENTIEHIIFQERKIMMELLMLIVAIIMKNCQKKIKKRVDILGSNTYFKEAIRIIKDVLETSKL